MTEQNIVCLIPARGGSKRLPRKNLRLLHGVPLIAHAISKAQQFADEVWVSTEDDEIADLAAVWGADVHERPAVLSMDDATVEDVVRDFAGQFDGDDVLVAMQATCVTLEPHTVSQTVREFVAGGRAASVTLVTPERHLLWDQAGNPLYRHRRNSTTIGDPDYFREIGCMVTTLGEAREASQWPPSPRAINDVSDTEGLDVDTVADFASAHRRGRPIAVGIFTVSGPHVGTGHVHRGAALATELAAHAFVEVDPAEPGVRYDVVVLDRLDTDVDEVTAWQSQGSKVITLEDLGPGAVDADAVVNELYRADRMQDTARLTFHGPRWAVLRPEFCGHQYRPPEPHPERHTVVVTFGGTDPSDLTRFAVDALATLDGVDLRVIVPPSRRQFELPLTATMAEQVTVVHQPLMAREFLDADLVVSGAGRTVHEAAACGAPIVAIAANEREAMHDVCPGVHYLGHWSTLSKTTLRSMVARLLDNYDERADMSRAAHDAVDGLGTQRLAHLIVAVAEGML